MNAECAKEQVAYYMRRLYGRCLTTTLGGNISIRIDDTTVAITPSGTDKGAITAEEVGVVDLEGNLVSGRFKTSIETELHLAVYRKRADINAIVHAHPVTICAFAASTAELNCSMIIESAALIGRVAYADYHPMGTPELASAVAEAAESANCIIMRNHGGLAAGSGIVEAFERLEVMENAAKMTLIAMGPLKGTLSLLKDEQINSALHI